MIFMLFVILCVVVVLLMLFCVCWPQYFVATPSRIMLYFFPPLESEIAHVKNFEKQKEVYMLHIIIYAMFKPLKIILYIAFGQIHR